MRQARSHDHPAPDRRPGARGDATLFEPGRNCWRVAEAEMLALIVDAADYFQMLRYVMTAAEREILLVGWDFDFEIEMLPGQSDADGIAPDGLPNRIGDFITALVERTPDLHVYLLKWNGALLLAPGRVLPTLALQIFGSDRIHFALDSHHPFRACHHQKIVVADDGFAFCGGIDVTEDRWDTSGHLPDDPRRVRKNGKPAPPWHDAMAALTGPAASALGELARGRWHRATGDELSPPDHRIGIDWPDELEVMVRGIDVAIARTEPPFGDEPLVDEIECLYLDQIAAARRSLYIESQYFAAESVCDALEARLREPDGPEIVVVNPQAALSALEDDAMHVLRGRMIERLCDADAHGRFRIFHPVTTAGEPIYVHAKVFVVDDRILRIGSSNLDDRSMGFDSECDIAFERPDDAPDAIARFRNRLLAEHLDVSPERFARTLDETGSLIAAIEALNRPEGRGLRRIVRMPESLRGRWLADTRILDPRYRRGEATDTGRGVRPRHLAIAAGIAGAGVLGWLAWRRWGRGPGARGGGAGR